MVMTRGMKKALSQKTSIPARAALKRAKTKANTTTRTHPMRTRNGTHPTPPTAAADELDSDGDARPVSHRLFCAENEILRLTNVNNSLALQLHNALETHTNLIARLSRLEDLLPPSPTGHPLPIKQEPVDNESVERNSSTIPVQ